MLPKRRSHAPSIQARINGALQRVPVDGFQGFLHLARKIDLNHRVLLLASRPRHWRGYPATVSDFDTPPRTMPRMDAAAWNAKYPVGTLVIVTLANRRR